MIYRRENAFKDGISSEEDYSELYRNIDLPDVKNHDREGPFFSASSLINGASLPSIIMDMSLVLHDCGFMGKDFEDILHASGNKVVFRNRYVRERFSEFSKKVREINPKIFSMNDVFSIFEDGNFKKVVIFRSINDMFGRIKIMISVLSFGNERSINPAILEDLFGFTPAEGRLAALLVNGKSVIECADELGVRISTVREQLSSLFAKTRTSRQPELVAMLSKLDLIV